MSPHPYVLAIASHKGGTGRTMTAIGMARAIADRGKRVLLIDGNVTPTLELLLGADKQGAPIEERELLPSVYVGTGRPGEAARLGVDYVILDCPPLFDRGADAFIGRAHGVILTTLPDPLAIRTIPGATSVLKEVLALHDDLSFLGIVVSIYKSDDPLQLEMLDTLRSRLGELCLEPPLPWQKDVADWSMDAKGELPRGAYGKAHDRLVEELAADLGLEVADATERAPQESAEEVALLSSERERGPQRRAPYRLVVASHKGGTGRTTTTLALGAAFAALGKRVLLLDANVTKTLHLFSQGGKRELFPGVTLGQTAADADDARYDLVMVDAPPIFEAASRELCERADGVLLTTLPDPLAFRTIPGATRALVDAKRVNAELELLGICVSVYDADDPLQRDMVRDLRERLGDFCLETPIPLQDEFVEWGLLGGPVPEGAAGDAYARLARELAPRIFEEPDIETAGARGVAASSTRGYAADRSELVDTRSAGEGGAAFLAELTLGCERAGTKPFVLSLSSHKGGTGRSVATLALATILGERGRRVLVLDARATRTLQLFSATPGDGTTLIEAASNVRVASRMTAMADCIDFAPDLVLVDTPPLLEQGCDAVLDASDAVLLTVLPDPLAIRTIPAAIHALRAAEARGARFDHFGVLVNLYCATDPLQAGIWPEIRQQLGQLCFGEPVPWQQEVADWAMQPGAQLPRGAAFDVYCRVADRIEEGVFGIQAATEAKGDQARVPFDEVDTYVLAVSDLAEDEASLTAAALIVAWMTSILGRKVVLVGSALTPGVRGGGKLRFARPDDEHFAGWHGVDLVLFDGCGGAEFSELVGRCHELLETLRDDEDSDGILDLARETLDATGGGRQVLHILMSLLDAGAARSEAIARAACASEGLVSWARQLATGEVRAPAVDVLLEVLATIEEQITSFEEDWWIRHDFELTVDARRAAAALGLQSEVAALGLRLRFEPLGTEFPCEEGRVLRPGKLARPAATVLVQKGVVYSEVCSSAATSVSAAVSEPRAATSLETGQVVELLGHGHGALGVGLRAFLQRRYTDALAVLAANSTSSDACFLAGVLALALGRPQEACLYLDRAVAQAATLGEELGLLGLGVVLDLDCGDGLVAHCGINPRAASLLRLFASMVQTASSGSADQNPILKNPTASADGRGELS